MATVLDQTQDLSGADQYRLTNLHTPPEFVKQASDGQLYGDPATVPSHLYAHPTQRLYPCHHKAATWLSAVFFGDKRASLDPTVASRVEANLVKQATYFSILPQVRAVWEKMAKQAGDTLASLPDSAFALVWDANGTRHRNYPLRGSQEVKAASDFFGRHHNEFVFSDKHTIATKILQKAHEFSAPIEHGELLRKCAGYGYCPTETAVKEWEKRATLLNRTMPVYAAEATKMAASLKQVGLSIRDQGCRIKLADLLDQFDRQTHLDRLYTTGGLQRPEEVLFEITEKVASDVMASHVHTPTGAVYDAGELTKLSYSTVEHWMGTQFADAVSVGCMLDVEKLAEAMTTMPRSDAVMFDRMAKAATIDRVAQGAAAEPVGLSDEERQALAQQYQASSHR